MAGRTLHVYADWLGHGGPLLVGQLHVSASRGKESYIFDYDRDWLARPGQQPLDPDLHLFAGPQYPAGDRMAFGVFLDPAPDRWGRTLLQRKEARTARQEGRAIRTLTATDLLLGVSDRTRMLCDSPWPGTALF